MSPSLSERGQPLLLVSALLKKLILKFMNGGAWREKGGST